MEFKAIFARSNCWFQRKHLKSWTAHLTAWEVGEMGIGIHSSPSGREVSWWIWPFCIGKGLQLRGEVNRKKTDSCSDYGQAPNILFLKFDWVQGALVAFVLNFQIKPPPPNHPKQNYFYNYTLYTKYICNRLYLTKYKML